MHWLGAGRSVKSSEWVHFSGWLIMRIIFQNHLILSVCVCVFRAVTIFISFVESLIPTGPGLLNTTATTSLTSKTPTLKFSSRPYRLMLNSGVHANLCPLHVCCTAFVMLGLAARSLSRWDYAACIPIWVCPAPEKQCEKASAYQQFGKQPPN